MRNRDRQLQHLEKLIGRPKHRGIQKDPLLGGGEGECNVEEVDCDNWMLSAIYEFGTHLDMRLDSVLWDFGYFIMYCGLCTFIQRQNINITNRAATYTYFHCQ